MIQQKRNAYPLRVAHNYQLDIEVAREMANWAYSAAGIEEILQWRGLSARRADTLPYSGLLLSVLLDVLKPSRVVIAPGGLREGLVYDAFSPAQKARPALFDACNALAKGRQQSMNFGAPLFEFLAPLGAILPHYFDGENENRLRAAACLLAGIGKGLHPDHKARMVFRMVLYAPLPNLTHQERAYLALILFSSYTSKKTTPNDAALMCLLPEGAQASARLYGEAMRLGVDISGRSHAVLAQCALEVNAGQVSLNANSNATALLTQKCQLRVEKMNDLINIFS